MLGFSKTFIIVFLISLLVWWKVGFGAALGIMCLYALIKIIWKILT